jgi:hypothetical protein
MFGAAPPNFVPADISKLDTLMLHWQLASPGREVNESDRLVDSTATGSCYARYGHSDSCVAVDQGSTSHGAGNLFTHGAVFLDQPGGHVKHLGFRRVGVRDESAVEYVRGTWNGRECRRNQATGARLRRSDRVTSAARCVKDLGRKNR